MAVTTLADRLYSEGYHYSGPFFGEEELARGLVRFGFDLALRKLCKPIKLVTLAEAIEGGEFKGKVEGKGDRGNFDFSDVYLIYAKPAKNRVETGPAAALVQLRTTKNQRIILYNNPLKKG